MSKLLETAVKVAKDWHDGQLRKYSLTPYIEHPLSVMRMVSKFTSDSEVLAAAVLHDVLEDTECGPEEIADLFGENVLRIVQELTDRYTSGNYPNLNRKERKFLEALRLKDISQEAKLIKYFDIMDNSSSIFDCDPKFSKVYLKEKQFILGYSLADLNL